VVEFAEAVRLLLAGSDRRRLVERAFAEFDRWLEWRGGTIGGAPRPALEVSFCQQSVVFRKGDLYLGPAHVITCLSFEVRDYDDAEPGPYQVPGGVYELLTGLDGEPFEERVDLDGELPVEGLGRGAWEFHGGHHSYFGPIPRGGRVGGDDDIPF
jgi:hypothetical protein